MVAVRSLILDAPNKEKFKNLEAPVAGARSGKDICVPTTGEVNLYLDPNTFGTDVPHFLADCEGMFGSEPAATKYQNTWPKQGRSYLLQSRGERQIDRKTAVMTLYPRFLYIFSDVICMITKNQKAWADSAVKLLQWSLAGAHNTVNQYALPALIIVLNGPSIQNESWVSDHDAATRDFFTTVEREIVENTTLQEMAKKASTCPARHFILVLFEHMVPVQDCFEVYYQLLTRVLIAWRQIHERPIVAKLLQCPRTLYPPGRLGEARQF